MTELDGTLSELARLRSGSEPIVSLYLDVRWADEKQRDRIRLFVQERVRQCLAHYLPDSPGTEGLHRTLDRIQKWVSGLTGQAYEADKNGVVLFACESLKLWRTQFFRRSFKNALELDAIPHLGQLARLADDLEPAIVVAPFQGGAQIWHVTLGELEIEATLRGYVPRSDKDTFNAGTGGHPGRQYEREKKNERHQEAFIQKNLRATAGEVTRLCDEGKANNVILVGTSETVAAFERELPERVREHVIARVPRPREWESGNGARKDGVIQHVVEAVGAHEKEKEQAVIDSLVGQALRGGLAVLGTPDVIEAVNQGRVHKLVIESDLNKTGWRCDNCDALGSTTHDTCPYCNGSLRAVPNLSQALIARTLAEGGEVEIVPQGNKLHSYRGVGAFLRQTSQTALRGASQPWPTAPGANQP
ncbi:MAG TPA: hypothetical protein VD838_06630 [Anaeromyxobacteraceae bacterium]|nr:hypothetical protein [Anaeromyxobacteraceae bacterium]